MRILVSVWLVVLGVVPLSFPKDLILGIDSVKEWVDADWKWRKEHIAGHVRGASGLHHIDRELEVFYIFYMHGCMDGAARKAIETGEQTRSELRATGAFKESNQKETYQGTLLASRDRCSQDFRERLLPKFE